jgi:anthranilate synthase component 2
MRAAGTAMILVIDNYDSFTYNLVQYLAELGAQVEVRRNDRIDVDGVRALAPGAVVISPGPGRPEDAGVSEAIVADLGAQVPVLGVCLGHQCIGRVFGGQIVRAPELMHGKTSLIHHRGEGVFAALPEPFVATRYHSLVIAAEAFPAALEITAWTEDGTVMGVCHRTWRHIQGVQFHPESILTAAGKALLRNFLESLPSA